MTLKILFDDKRRREIRDGLKHGRLDLRKTKIGVPQDGAPSMDDKKALTPAEVQQKLEQLMKELPPVPRVDEDLEDPREMVRKISSELTASAKECQNQLHVTMLATSIIGGRLERVIAAHQGGADLNADMASSGITDAQGNLFRTALQIALEQGRQDIISYLRKHGAKD